MKKFFGYLTGLSAIFSNIVQIAFVVLLLPLFGFIIGEIFGFDESGRMMLQMAGEVPYFKWLTEFISQFTQYHATELIGEADQYLMHIATVMDAVEDSMVQLLNVTLSVSVFKLVHNLLKINGAAIVATVVGTFVGYIIAALYPIPLMASAFFMLLYMVIDMIFVQEIQSFSLWGLVVKYFISSLKFSLDMIATLWASGLVAIFLILWHGGETSLLTAVIIVIAFAIPFLIVVLAKRAIFKKD